MSLFSKTKKKIEKDQPAATNTSGAPMSKTDATANTAHSFGEIATAAANQHAQSSSDRPSGPKAPVLKFNPQSPSRAITLYKIYDITTPEGKEYYEAMTALETTLPSLDPNSQEYQDKMEEVTATLKTFSKVAPLYVAFSEQDAAEACYRLAFIQNFEHFKQWAALHDFGEVLTPQVVERAFPEYVVKVLGGADQLINNYFIATHDIAHKDLASILRNAFGSTCVLGFGETQAEMFSLIYLTQFDNETGEVIDFADQDPDDLLPQQLAFVRSLNCPNPGAYLGRLSYLIGDSWVEYFRQIVEAYDKGEIDLKGNGEDVDNEEKAAMVRDMAALGREVLKM